MAEVAVEAIVAILNELMPTVTQLIVGRLENDSGCLDQVKTDGARLNEMVRQSMDFLNKINQYEGEHRTLNSIRLHIAQACSLVDSIQYHIKKGCKGNATWGPIAETLKQLLSTFETFIPQFREQIGKVKDPRNNRPENSIMDIYEKEALQLKQWMFNSSREHSVIAICGMVGTGKTTLARIAFNSAVQTHDYQVGGKKGSIPMFERKIWASASGGCSGDPLAEKVIALLENPSERVATELQNDLEEKSCLIVLDDLQNISGWAWLRDKLNKSTLIIVTTSSKGIAHSVCRKHLIQLEPLRQKRALEVFCLKAFNQHNFPINWTNSRRSWAEKIVHHCGGLPLAIVAFGDYVKELGSDDCHWEGFPETLYFFMENENEIIKLIPEVIKFRIRELPYHLIRGLMYFSMYPDGYVFNRNRMLRLLVSHNYFTESRNRNSTLEQFTDKVIFKSLHDRYLLQVSDQCVGNEAPPHRFCIPNVVRQVVRSLSEEEYFGKLLDKSDDTIDCSRHHHVIIDGGVEENIDNAPKLCSVSFLGHEQMPKICSQSPGFVLLRVLSLRNAKIEDVHVVKNLLLLRYLDLKYTNVRACSWLVFLEELQTLDLRHTYVKAVPTACLQKLQKLRHLLLGYIPMMHRLEITTNNIYTAKNSYVPDELRHPLESTINFLFSGTSRMMKGVAVEINKLRNQNLQTLRGVKAPKELSKLSGIAELFITGIKKHDMISFWNSVEKLEKLTSLGFASNSPIELKGGAQLKRRLQKLHMQGSFSNQFDELCEFENLNELTLALSGIKEGYPIREISRLSHLLCLKLYNVSNAKTLTFGPDGFEKLTKLVIADMNELELINIASGIMGRITTVKLCDLPKLNGLVIRGMGIASDQYILSNNGSELLSCLEISSLKSIFLRNINHVGIINGPDVYKYNGYKKCYVAEAYQMN